MNTNYKYYRKIIIILLNAISVAIIGALIFNSLRQFIVTLLSYIIIIPSYYLYFKYFNINRITRAKLLYIFALILTPIALLIIGMALAFLKPILWLVVFFICAAGFVNGIINYAIINIATKNIKWYELLIVVIISFFIIFLLYEFFIQ